MAYIQQEKAFRFSRIRIFRVNITKASIQSQNLNSRIAVGLNVETFMGVLGETGHIETLIWSKEFLQVRLSRPMLPTPNPPFILQFNIFKWALKWRFLRIWLAELKAWIPPVTLNQFWAVCHVCFFVCFFTKMTLHVLLFPPTFLVKVTTWSLDYNTSSEATIAAGFFKISHWNENKRKKKQVHFPVQHMYRYLYSYIFIYIGGVEYCRIILHVLINKPRQKQASIQYGLFTNVSFR